ncbi:MAG: hypothetical protein K0Q49_1460 [Haloplasmataceae bacterium]|jgi:hypothetical protein|nr:hypothetical protein [Haloplasmataceae bacterium]
MVKVLEKYKINFILLQMIAFSFICIMAYVDEILGIDLKFFLRISILSFTTLAVVIYEIIIFVFYKKAKNSYEIDPNSEKNKINYNERYLWFVILLLLDVIIIVSFIAHRFGKIDIIIPLVIGFILYSVISTIVKPYFGINHKK